MTIAEARTSCKAVLARIPRDVLIVALIIAASLSSFGLGILAGRAGGGGSSVAIEATALQAAAVDSNSGAAAAAAPAALSAGGAVVASRNGSKYYAPWCGGAKVIKPENLITFASADAARAAGYAPAANCKGL